MNNLVEYWVMGGVLGQLNWIDFVVVLIVIYYVYEGWGRGLISQLMELAGFAGALWVALKIYAIVGSFLSDKFGISPGWAKLVGFAGVAFLAEWMISEVMVGIYRRIPKKILETRWNKLLGVIPSAISGLVVVSFFLLLVLGLPIRGDAKKDIREAKIGGYLVQQAAKVEKGARSIFEEALSETAKFVTIHPASTEKINLTYEVPRNELVVDTISEAKMLELVNGERAKVGAKQLVVDPKIVEVARKHSRDMWERQYFSHVNPDGKDPFDRMRAGGVSFSAAGENLALAPDVGTAHRGLMESEGHKRNILDPDYGRIGIGVVDGGIYGKMFTQNFAD